MQGLLWKIGTISDAVWFSWINNVMEPQIRALESYNKGTPVHKDYRRWIVCILNKS